MKVNRSLKFIFVGFAILVYFISNIPPTVVAFEENSVGIKKGDWIEYAVNVTGGIPPSKLAIDSFRIEILEVSGAAFRANFTVRYINGTVDSSVWKYNLTEGQVGGWTIIPSNLDVGDTFYDCLDATNVTIEGEEQQFVAGSMRNIIYSHDSIRLVKKWDKITGVYVYSKEQPKNLTLITTAVATNMWSPQIFESNNAKDYSLAIIAFVLAPLISFLVLSVAPKKKIKKQALSYLSQGKIVVFTIIMVVLITIGTLIYFPFFEIGLSFAEINLIMQTFWTSLVITSMLFRIKGNYFAHEITMLIVICGSLVDFSAVLLTSSMNSGSLQIYSSSSLRLVLTLFHSIVSIPALGFGFWLVALWRPNSTSFAVRSKRIAQITAVSWILSYIAGVLSFVAIHTTFFG